VVVAVVRPHHTHLLAPAPGPLHPAQHTGGQARQAHTGGRSSAPRTESHASTSHPDMARRRSKREKSASPDHPLGSSRLACWACAGQEQGRRRPERPQTRPRQWRTRRPIHCASSNPFGWRPPVSHVLCVGRPTDGAIIDKIKRMEIGPPLKRAGTVRSTTQAARAIRLLHQSPHCGQWRETVPQDGIASIFL
jgi:hypothetical protein